MPWEITIVRSPTNEKVPLGAREAIIDIVANALPGAALENPALPPEDFFNTLSPTVREAFTRPQLKALYEDGDLTFEFHTWDLLEIPFLCADVRGNPLPVLSKLCVPNSWSVISAHDRSVVDLTAGSAPQWERFRAFRDEALRDEE